MKKKLLQFTTIAIILLLAACSNDDIIEKNDNNPALPTGRTLSLTATMPSNNSDDPTTRVGLEQQEDNTIALVWEENDELQLAFVQGETKRKSIATVGAISEDGKKAQFDIVIPDGITDGEFNLYGVYGGGGLDENNPTLVKLPENAGSAGSLATIQTRKDVMLHFASLGVQTATPKVSVAFKHLGSLFSITFADAITQEMLDDITTNNITEARLVGVNNEGNVNWAYNAGTAAGNSYDLLAGEAGEFQNPESSGNHISFSLANSDLTIGQPLTVWAWYPPLIDAIWPELSLELINTSNEVVATTANTKPARTEFTPAGKSYLFYAAWDGTELNFTDKSFIPTFAPPRYHVMPMGTLSTMLNQTQRDTITTMVITGEINKADFNVMKRMMPKLKYIDLSNVKCDGNKIPREAFGGYSPYGSNQNTTISTIILPLSITSIEMKAFERCTGLMGDLKIPEGVTTIRDDAFNGCTGFTGSLTIPEGVTKIGEYAFSRCTGFTGTLTIPEGVTAIGNGAFQGCENLTGSMIIPESLTSISDGVFSGCSSFTGFLTIPKNVTSIGGGAFSGCTGFTGSLTIPEGITEIGIGVFQNCTGLTGSLIIPESVTKIWNRAFKGCKGFTGSLKIPEGVTNIGGDAFNGCTDFTGTLTIPKGVTTIEDRAFSECTGLTGSLTIPEGITSIGNNAFQSCEGFTGSLTIPEGVTKIGELAFYHCTGFTGKVVFPESLTSIGARGFEGCTNIEAFRFPHITPVPYLYEYGIGMLPAGKNVEVPASSKAKYKATDGWKNHPILGYYPLEGDLPGMY